MASAQLLRLMDNLRARRFHFRANLCGLMADHDKGALRWRDLQSGLDRLPHQRLSSSAMQYLGHARFHSGPLPCGKNYYSDVIEH
jgi:hypothetical protein